jgi:UDP-2,3-diacylglucosamine hydrolase
MRVEAYFLSDIHLRQLDQPEGRALLGFLEDVGPRIRASHLFLVGDIFDFWLGGHDYFIRRFSPLVDHLKRIFALGVEVHYFEGNHDLYLRDLWQDRLGLRVHVRPRMFQLGDLRVRVEHGDLLDPTDRGYRFLRRVLRTGLVAYTAGRLPGAVLAGIGRIASRTSRRYTSRHKTISDERARATVRSHAERVVQEQPFDLIITGHVHVRDDYAFEYEGRRIRSVNLGSWAEAPCAFRITTERQEFIEISLPQAENNGVERGRS